MKDYMIPVNVNSRFEFFTGFGIKELVFSLIGFAIGGILALIIGLILSPFVAIEKVSEITKTVIQIILIIIPTGIMFFGSKKNPRTGFSPFDFIKQRKIYFKQQNKYFYVFGSGGGFFERKN